MLGDSKKPDTALTVVDGGATAAVVVYDNNLKAVAGKLRKGYMRLEDSYCWRGENYARMTFANQVDAICEALKNDTEPFITTFLINGCSVNSALAFIRGKSVSDVKADSVKPNLREYFKEVARTLTCMPPYACIDGVQKTVLGHTWIREGTYHEGTWKLVAKPADGAIFEVDEYNYKWNEGSDYYSLHSRILTEPKWGPTKEFDDIIHRGIKWYYFGLIRGWVLPKDLTTAEAKIVKSAALPTVPLNTSLKGNMKGEGLKPDKGALFYYVEPDGAPIVAARHPMLVAAILDLNGITKKTISSYKGKWEDKDVKTSPSRLIDRYENGVCQIKGLHLLRRQP